MVSQLEISKYALQDECFINNPDGYGWRYSFPFREIVYRWREVSLRHATPTGACPLGLLWPKIRHGGKEELALPSTITAGLRGVTDGGPFEPRLRGVIVGSNSDINARYHIAPTAKRRENGLPCRCPCCVPCSPEWGPPSRPGRPIRSCLRREFWLLLRRRFRQKKKAGLPPRGFGNVRGNSSVSEYPLSVENSSHHKSTIAVVERNAEKYRNRCSVATAYHFRAW